MNARFSAVLLLAATAMISHRTAHPAELISLNRSSTADSAVGLIWAPNVTDQKSTSSADAFGLTTVQTTASGSVEHPDLAFPQVMRRFSANTNAGAYAFVDAGPSGGRFRFGGDAVETHQTTFPEFLDVQPGASSSSRSSANVTYAVAPTDRMYVIRAYDRGVPTFDGENRFFATGTISPANALNDGSMRPKAFEITPNGSTIELGGALSLRALSNVPSHQSTTRSETAGLNVFYSFVDYPGRAASPIGLNPAVGGAGLSEANTSHYPVGVLGGLGMTQFLYTEASLDVSGPSKVEIKYDAGQQHFSTLLIPEALPGGDTKFLVKIGSGAGAVEVPVQVGQELVLGNVSSFTLSGIDYPGQVLLGGAAQGLAAFNPLKVLAALKFSDIVVDPFVYPPNRITTTANIVSVPEPSSMGLLMFATGLVFISRRMWRKL